MGWVKKKIERNRVSLRTCYFQSVFENNEDDLSSIILQITTYVTSPIDALVPILKNYIVRK